MAISTSDAAAFICRCPRHRPSRCSRHESLDEVVSRINGSPQLLHHLLEEQHYRLAYWRPANDEINYRRFFGINELIAIHAEDEEVFARSHALILKLAAEDVVDGVRVDHVDGLLDPVAYLQQLRTALEAAAPARPWIVVEKVLDTAERLDVGWPVDGTTGYDALDALNRLFVSGRGVSILRRFYRASGGRPHVVSRGGRAQQATDHAGTLRSGMTMLAHELKRVADASWTTRDIALNSLQEALVEFVAALPVYRTYLGTGHDHAPEHQIVLDSLDAAERRNPSMDASAFAFLRSLLFGEPADKEALTARRAAVVKRLQQYTSGVQAKGVEDTAFFRDNTLLALSEVGGNPADRSMTTREFHLFNAHRAKVWPHSMTATSTHDTKLSEDARTRIATLSVYAAEWTEAVRRWRTLNAALRRSTRRGSCPDVRDEYRLYQALVGVWDESGVENGGRFTAEFVERLAAYARKSAREAQLSTSWIRPDADYEQGLDAFVRGALAGDEAKEFRCAVGDFVRMIRPVSECNSISQLVLKCLMPGVPDFYQGSEDWTFTLTDPDNRRPVDFARASERLARSFESRAAAGCRGLKTLVTATLLQFRADHGPMFRDAAYRPLRVRGSRSGSVVAFERRGPRSRTLVIVPRLTTRPPHWPLDASFWGDTEVRLPGSDGRWTSLLASDEVMLERPWSRISELDKARPWVVLYRARLRSKT